MKAASSALIALLQTGLFVLADLYTITLVSGAIIRLTTADRDVAVSGQVYVSTGPFVDVGTDGRTQKATSSQKIGLDVDSRTITIVPRVIDPLSQAAFPDRVGSQPFVAAIHGGAFDGATVQMDRAFWPAWTPPGAPLPAPAGIVLALFAGRVAAIEIDRGAVSITVNSHLELLTQQLPRNFYGPSCKHALFDVGCGLSASVFAVGGALTGVQAPNVVTSTVGAPKGSGTYARGRLVFTSGQNAGVSRMVRSWAAATGVFTLIAPLPFQAQAGDAFVAYPGCDLSQGSCVKFSNLVNFGGEPFVPSVETAV